MTRAAFLGGVLTLACVQTADAQVAKPPVHSRPAASGNYSHSTSRKTGVVIHKMEGTNAEVWFANPAARASTQYSVHFDGSIWQSVPDANVAWHCGNTAFNTAFLSIEHAGWSAKNDVTEAEYRASARLVAWMCVHYGIPIDRRHLIGHGEVPDPNHPGQFGGVNHHTDPGRFWNWDHYLNLVRTYANGQAPAGGAAVPGGAGGSTSSGALRNGSRGPAVAELQRLLVAKGFNPGPIDGIFGSRTDGAVRAFQRARGLVVDGIAGP
ncbi:MAG: N-acetylmuramoyl-L-alanine amidase, partial [Planctomycetota bacterium]